jgi:hypothetical protein
MRKRRVNSAFENVGPEPAVLVSLSWIEEVVTIQLSSTSEPSDIAVPASPRTGSAVFCERSSTPLSHLRECQQDQYKRCTDCCRIPIKRKGVQELDLCVVLISMLL